MKRRQFLKGLLAGLALTGLDPRLALAAPRDSKILVAVHLTGGNDALNTLVPHRDKIYKKARTNLRLASKSLLETGEGLALHPSLKKLHNRFQDGKVLFLPGIGRDDHDRSHFRSSDIWHGGGSPGDDGWMAKLGLKLKSTPISLGSSVSRAVACPSHPPVGLVGDRAPSFPGSEKIQKAWFDMYRNWSPPSPIGKRLQQSARVVEDLATKLESKMVEAHLHHHFEDNEFGKRFELAYRLIASGFPSELIHISAGKFDTHSGQLSDHSQQLAQFDRASHAFLENLKSLDKSPTLMVYSEFGRRVSENFSGGTDHGAAGLAWLVGDKVQGGIEGGYDLQNLRDGDLPTTLHFRELYKKAISGVFGSEHTQLV